MSAETESIHAAILARHKTLYAFCGAVGLPRGTVYQVIRGRYAGDIEKQLKRISKALESPRANKKRDAERIQKALAKSACAQCENGKRRCRKVRHVCQALWAAQTAAVMGVLEVLQDE